MSGQHTLIFVYLLIVLSSSINASPGKPHIGRRSKIASKQLCNGEAEVIKDDIHINFPKGKGYYDNDQDCRWKIQAPKNHIIKMTIRLDIEECRNCLCDSLTVSDRKSKTELKRMCGLVTEKPLTVYSLTNRVNLRFMSDHSKVFSGFKMKIDFIYVPAVGFFAVKTSTLEALAEPVVIEFDEIKVNVNGSFNDKSDKSQFTCPVSGNYYFALSAGATAMTPVWLVLRKNGRPFASVVRQAKEHNNVDIISRSIIMPLEQNDVIDVVLNSFTTAFSDTKYQTSLTGFLLPYFPEVADNVLFAGQIFNRTHYMGCENTELEKRLLGGDQWGTDHKTFKFPSTGIYMGGIGAGVNGTFHIAGDAVFKLNGDIKFGLYKASNTYLGFDTLSRDFMLEGHPQDNFALEFCNLVALSSQELQTYMSMFLVSSAQRSRTLFSGTKSESTTVGGIIKEYSIETQVGNSFNAETGMFTCWFPGVYFITFSVSSIRYYPADVSLMLNKDNTVAAGLTRLSYAHDGGDTFSRALLINLKTGDQLYLKLEDGSQILSGGFKLTSFSGFLLYNADRLE